MSPALKRKAADRPSRVKPRLRTATAGAAPQRSHPREQQEAIERAYRQDAPHVPSLPGAVKVGILVSGVAASWFAVFSVIKAIAG